MIEYLRFLALLFVAMVVIFGAAIGMNVANEYWQCSSYEGAKTKLMAGNCYAQAADGKWVLFSSYVKEFNVSLKGGAK